MTDPTELTDDAQAAALLAYSGVAANYPGDRAALRAGFEMCAAMSEQLRCLELGEVVPSSLPRYPPRRD
jgi:hypothetical protein